MPSVHVGIHLHAAPEDLEATVASLRTNTAHPIDVLLLPDGPDAETSAALAARSDLPQSGTTAPLGAAACLNRLADASQADILVLLESGSLVGPGWLDHLLAALGADPRHGLAGPSTNHAWNEQCVLYHGGMNIPDSLDARSPDQVADLARAVDRHFAGAWRILAPLYSLADFCYVVTREVIEAIGDADEGYGLGPCWEMDYNIRAARAGFQGVWACSAYVHRLPFTARRVREEPRLFEVSKRRYQDKFCALRLRRERPGYEPHCRGETCEHFAPPGLIQIHMPVSGAGTAPEPTGHGVEPPPLVSCIMVTGDRADFVRQSIRYFQRQDYPARELLILDDGHDDCSDAFAGDSRIRHVRLPEGLSIGAKRNRGCELARGSIVAHWDDDDWYAPNRLSVQVAPLLAEEADITGLDAGIFFDLARWQFWTCTPDLHRRLFIEDVHGGTLVYLRRCWERLAQYPDCSLAEDAGFLFQAVRQGARLRRLSNDHLFIYLRHRQNSWAFECGQFLDPRGWQQAAEPELPGEDRAFYAARSSVAPPPALPAAPPSKAARGAPDSPLVSCLMPTADRRAFVPQAIRYFLRQEYARRELLILDDGADPIRDLVPPDPRIRYVRLTGEQTLGAKYNLAAGLAQGDILAHWDDDDWMAEWRLSYQVCELLRQPPAALCGLARLLCYEPSTDRAWEYVYPYEERPWLCGGTLCYRKAFWERHVFPDVNVGWDTVFAWSLTDVPVIPFNDHTFYVLTVHPGNSSPKKTDGFGWHPLPSQKIRHLLKDDCGFYDSLARARVLAG